MVRPLRKSTLDGTLYSRREIVEAEIQELATVSQTELEYRTSIFSSTSPGFVSSEALVYFVRNLGAGLHRDKVTEYLLQRVYRRIPRAENFDESTISLTKENIREDVVDRFIDLLLSDRVSYDDRLDYYEINFNSAIARDRKDASARHWKYENRSEELFTDDASLAAGATISGYDPFDHHDLDQKSYRLQFDNAIDGLPEIQRRIIEMLLQDIPIDSQDPSAVTISKALGKSEKTIRTHRDKAFATLRLRLERKGKQ